MEKLGFGAAPAAIALGCPAEKMGDSAHMNIWLHKIVMRNLAENVPQELLE